MEAMEYELLLRKIYKCGKHELGGKLHAENYRRMERSIRLYEGQKKALAKDVIPLSTKPLYDLEYEMRVAISEIMWNVQVALEEQRQNINDKNLGSELDKLIADLLDGDVNKALLDDVIDKAGLLLKEDQ